MSFPSNDPSHVFRDFVTNGIPSSGAWNPRKPEIRRLLKEHEAAIIALIGGQGGDIDLARGVIYFSITGGTADAITAEADADLPENPGSAIFILGGIAQPNTGPVTINGKPLRTNSGNEIVPGGLIADGIYLFLDAGDDYRLLSDQASASIIAAAEGWAVQAGERADDAENAADRAEGFAAMQSADKVKFPTVPALLADEMMSYDDEPDHIQVGPGDIIEAQGFRYEVAASDATDAWLIETAAGVKLSSIDPTPFPEAFAANGKGEADDTAACEKWVAYHTAKGLRQYRTRGGATYLIDGIIFPAGVTVEGGFAKFKRRVNNATRFIEFGEGSVGYDLIADGSLDTLGREGATNQQSGFVLDSYAKLYNCESFQHYRHGFSAIPGSVGVEGPELHSCYAHDNGAPHPTLPPSAGGGSGDGLNFTNVNNGVMRDCRSFNNARSSIVLTTSSDPSLSFGCLVINPTIGGAGYSGADINFEQVTSASLLNANVAGSGITFRASPGCTFKDIKCSSLRGAEGTHNTVVSNVEIENETRAHDLLLIQGDNPDVRSVKVKSTSPSKSGVAIDIRPSNRRGSVHDIDVEGVHNGIYVDVDNTSGLTGRGVVNNQVRYGPAPSGQGRSMGFIAALTVNAGVAHFFANNAPSDGTWERGSICRRLTAESGQPTYYQCSVAGSPGTWVAGPNFP